MFREGIFRHIQDNCKEERTSKKYTVVHCCGFDLHQKNVLTVRIVKLQNKFPGEVVESPSTEVL